MKVKFYYRYLHTIPEDCIPDGEQPAHSPDECYYCRLMYAYDYPSFFGYKLYYYNYDYFLLRTVNNRVIEVVYHEIQYPGGGFDIVFEKPLPLPMLPRFLNVFLDVQGEIDDEMMQNEEYANNDRCGEAEIILDLERKKFKIINMNVWKYHY